MRKGVNFRRLLPSVIPVLARVVLVDQQMDISPNSVLAVVERAHTYRSTVFVRMMELSAQRVQKVWLISNQTSLTGLA